MIVSQEDTMSDKKHLWPQRRRRISEIIEVGASDDLISRCYDIFSTLVLLINLTVTFLYTFDSMELRFGPTLLTVGYGGIYPITTMGKIVGIVITFLGVGMVAIPTGIISAGFVDQYSRIKRISEYAAEEDIHFIKVQLRKEDS